MKKKILYLILLFISFFLSALSTTTYAQEKAAGPSATFATILAQQKTDNRIQTLRAYLQKHNSPLDTYADVLVYQADLNSIPWDLLVAMSGTESTFGLEVPLNCNNAWGFGIYGDQRLCFNSYPEAIGIISKAIRHDYIDKWGAKDVYDIGKNYASSPAWGIHTDNFMHQIEEYQKELQMQDLPISI